MSKYLENLLKAASGDFDGMIQSREISREKIESLVTNKGAISIDFEWDPSDKEKITQLGVTFVSPLGEMYTVLYVIKENTHLEDLEGSYSNKKTAVFDVAILSSKEEAISEVNHVLTNWNYGCVIGHHVGHDLDILGIAEGSLPGIYDTKSQVLKLISPLRKAAKQSKVRGIALKRVCKALRVNSGMTYHNGSNDAIMTAMCALKLIKNPALSSIQLLNEVNEHSPAFKKKTLSAAA